MAVLKDSRGVPFLENEFNRPVSVGGISYPSAENAFQALRFPDMASRRKLAAMPTRQARAYGERFAPKGKYAFFDAGRAMAAVLAAKFSDRELAAALAETYPEPLAGIDAVRGTGTALERIRSEIIERGETGCPTTSP